MLLDKCNPPVKIPGHRLVPSHYQHARALVLCSRGVGTFAKTLHIVVVEVDSSPEEVDWDTLEREVAAYEEGLQGHHHRFFW